MQDPSGFWAPREKPGFPAAETATGAAARRKGTMFEKRIVSAYYLFDMGKEVLCKSSMDVCSQERMSRTQEKKGKRESI